MADSGINRFNLRVYGLLFNDLGQVLVSDEFRYGHAFTKFPGGGVEFGEGLHDALMRECREELQIDVTVKKLVYVNEFHQPSLFDKEQQLVAFYFHIESEQWKHIEHGQHTIPLTEPGEKHRWIHKADISQDMLTFPVDKKVATLLRELH
jgi:8-oxo-dGTP diphosphatase